MCDTLDHVIDCKPSDWFATLATLYTRFTNHRGSYEGRYSTGGGQEEEFSDNFHSSCCTLQREGTAEVTVTLQYVNDCARVITYYGCVHLILTRRVSREHFFVC